MGGPPELGRPQNFVEGFVGLIKEMGLQNRVLGLEFWTKACNSGRHELVRV